MSDELHMLYLFGPPASGKSTVFAEMMKHQTGTLEHDPLQHTRWEPSGIVELGGRRSEFSGTDTLPMNAITNAEKYVGEQYPPLLIAEGDRLAISRWFWFCEEAGYHLWLYYLDTPQVVRADRLAGRALLGGKQDPTWVKGRETKARNLARDWDVRRVNGAGHPYTIVCEILENATPFDHALRELTHD